MCIATVLWIWIRMYSTPSLSLDFMRASISGSLSLYSEKSSLTENVPLLLGNRLPSSNFLFLQAVMQQFQHKTSLRTMSWRYNIFYPGTLPGKSRCPPSPFGGALNMQTVQSKELHSCVHWELHNLPIWSAAMLCLHRSKFAGGMAGDWRFLIHTQMGQTAKFEYQLINPSVGSPTMLSCLRPLSAITFHQSSCYYSYKIVRNYGHCNKIIKCCIILNITSKAITLCVSIL